MCCRSGVRRPAARRTHDRVVATGLVVTAIAASTLGVRAELPEWVRNVETAGRWHDAIFRTVPTPEGAVEVRRSPADAYDALTSVPGAATDRELLALRARAAEDKLDPAAAEADWSVYATVSADAAAGQLALAHSITAVCWRRRKGMRRRRRPRGGFRRRIVCCMRPSGDRGGFRADIRARRRAQQLPDAFAEGQCRAWVARYPAEVGRPTIGCSASSSIEGAQPTPRPCLPAINGPFPPMTRGC